MSKPQAYMISGPDNGKFFLEAAPKDFFCGKCGCLVHKDYFPERLNFKMHEDISTTYDARSIVSERFKRNIEEMGMRGCTLKPFHGTDTIYYVIGSDEVVSFDVNARPVHYEGKCDVCGQFIDISKVLPIYLHEGTVLEDFVLYRTDIEPGFKERKSPLLLVNENTMRALKKRKLGGLYFFAPIQSPKERRPEN